MLLKMCNTIVEGHIKFIDQYLQDLKCLHRERAERLKEQMQGTSSLDELTIILTASITFPQPGFFKKLFFGQENSENHFIKRTTALLSTVEKLKILMEEEKTICENIDSIQANEQARSFVLLLKEVFTNPSYLLYEKILSVAFIVQERSKHRVPLQSIFDYLGEVKAPPKSESTKPRSGSFDAEQSVKSPLFQSSLDLLRKSSKVHDSHSDLCINVNNLLQLVLDLYQSNDERLNRLSALASVP